MTCTLTICCYSCIVLEWQDGGMGKAQASEQGKIVPNPVSAT